jgi:MFS family permease
MQSTAIPLYIQSFGFSKAAAGLNATLYSLTALVFRPVMGSLIDKRGRRTMLLFSSGLFAASILCFGAIGLVSSLALIYAMQIICGVAFSASSVSMTTICTDVIPQSRMTEGLGYFGLSSTLSTAIAPVIVLAVIEGSGYRMNFWVIAALLFISLFPGTLIKYEKNAKPQQSAEVPFERELQRKPAWWENIVERNSLLSSGIMMLCSFAYASILTFLPTFAAAFSIADIGLTFTLLAIGQALVRIFVGKATERLGKMRILYISFLLYFIGLFGIFIFRSPLLLAVLGFSTGAGFGAINTVLNTAAVVRAPQARRGAANATFYMFMDIGVGIGSALWGMVADAMGVQWIYLFSAFFVAVSAASAFCSRRQLR